MIGTEEQKLEKLEELVLNWIRFKEDDYEDRGDFMHIMEEIQRRKKEMKVLKEE